MGTEKRCIIAGAGPAAAAAAAVLAGVLHFAGADQTLAWSRHQVDQGQPSGNASPHYLQGEAVSCNFQSGLATAVPAPAH